MKKKASEKEKHKKMEKKRGRPLKMKKKRGRPKKLKQVEQVEGFKNSSNEGDGDSLIHQIVPYGHPASPEHASAPLDTPTPLGCRTRYAKALADQKAASHSPSSFAVQNGDGNPSDTSTLMLVKQMLTDAIKLPPASNAPVEVFASRSPFQAQELYSQQENICPDPDKTIEVHDDTPLKNVLDLKKFTSDLLSQTQEPELPFQIAPPCSEEIVVDNNLAERDADVVSNIYARGPEKTADRKGQTWERPTRSSSLNVKTVALMDNKSSEKNEVRSQLGSSSVDVNGYKVKKEMVPILKAIFSKYGDIATDSTFSMESRSCLLELVCSIYKRLEASKFTKLTPLELQSMLGQIGDLEFVKVEVGWLYKRLDHISKAKQLCGGISTLNDVEARILLVIDEKQKTVKTYEKELETCMAAVKMFQERLQQEKDELHAAMTMADQIKNFYEGSLVHGLI